MSKFDSSDSPGSTLRLGFLLAALVFVMAAASSAFGAEARWALAIGTASAAPQTPVELPVDLTTNGASVSAIAFSVEFDSSRLALDADPKLGSKVEIPAPTMFTSSSWVGTEEGAIGVVVYDRTRPIGILADGTIARIRFRVLPGATGFAPVRISTTKPFSAAGPRGERIEGEIVAGGGITIVIPTGASVPSTPGTRPEGDRGRPVERPSQSETELAVVIPIASGSGALLHNRGAESATARLTLLRDGTLPPVGPVEVGVPPGATRAWKEPAAELFGLPSTTGALLVERSSGEILAAASLERLATAADVSDRDLRMVGVEDSPQRPSGVTIANLHSESARFVIEVRDDEGALLYSDQIEVGPSAMRESTLRHPATSAGRNLTVLVRPLSPAARYAAWVTTRSGEAPPVIQTAR